MQAAQETHQALHHRKELTAELQQTLHLTAQLVVVARQSPAQTVKELLAVLAQLRASLVVL